MVWTIVFVLLLLWLLGVFAHPMGPLIHLLLAVALIVVIFHLIQGRRLGGQDHLAPAGSRGRAWRLHRTPAPTLYCFRDSTKEGAL